jgi:uncharacterized protein
MLFDPEHNPDLPEGWGFRALLAVAALMRSFGALLAMETSAILLRLPLEPLWVMIPMPRTLALNLLGGIPSAVMGLVVSWALLRFAHQAKLRDIGLAFTSWKELAGGMAGGALSVGLIVLPMWSLGWLTYAEAESRVRGPLGVVLLVGLIAIFAFAEELVMRGYAFQSMAFSWHLLGALVMTSGAFALMHWNNPGMNEFTIGNTFLAGCVLGMVVAWRRNLWAAVGAHFGWNMMTVLSGLNVSGLVIPLMPFKLTSVAGAEIWTGGRYGPEGSLICTIVLSLLLLGLVRLYYHRES